MVGVAEIRNRSVTFRAAIERCSEQLRSRALDQFPRGSCGDVSDMLGEFLQRTSGIECDYVVGCTAEGSHAWLEYGGVFIDITADQFPGNAPVIVSRDSVFHRQFSVQSRRPASLNRPAGKESQDLKRYYQLLVNDIQIHDTESRQ